MDMEKIAHWARVPRVIDKEIEEISVRPFRFLKKANREWEQEVANSPLVFVRVVQANRILYSSETSQYAPAVVTYTTDPAFALSFDFLRRVATGIYAAKEQPSPDPEVSRLGALLRDEQSNFKQFVPLSLTGGVQAHVRVSYLDPDLLPGRAIPEHRTLPAIIAPDRISYLPPRLYL